MTTSCHKARYRAIETINGGASVGYLGALDGREDGRVVGRTIDGHKLVCGVGYPVKITEVSTDS